MPKQITGQDIRTEPSRLGLYGKAVSRGDLLKKGLQRGSRSRASEATKATGGSITYSIIKPKVSATSPKKGRKKRRR